MSNAESLAPEDRRAVRVQWISLLTVGLLWGMAGVAWSLASGEPTSHRMPIGMIAIHAVTGRDGLWLLFAAGGAVALAFAVEGGGKLLRGVIRTFCSSFVPLILGASLIVRDSFLLGAIFVGIAGHFGCVHFIAARRAGGLMSLLWLVCWGLYVAFVLFESSRFVAMSLVVFSALLAANKLWRVLEASSTAAPTRPNAAPRVPST